LLMRLPLQSYLSLEPGLFCLTSRAMNGNWPGVDVMITVFCNFCQVLAKRLALFSRTNVMIKFFHNLALFWVKKRHFLGENIFKIITSVPWSIIRLDHT
jgi:hypothetical protein